MRFIHRWSYKCAKYLTDQLKENHEKRRVYYYGFQVAIGDIVKVILLIAISLLFRSVLPTLMVVIAFSLLRVFAGGYHMDTYGKCMVTTLALFLAAGILAQYTYKYWGVMHLFILFVFTLMVVSIVVYKWAPKDTANKPITKPEYIKKFRKLSLIYIIVWTVINLLLITYKKYVNNVDIINMITVSICFGVLLESFTIMPAGYAFFDAVSGRIVKKDKTKGTVDNKV